MNKKTVQLLSRETAPSWWTRLHTFSGLGCAFVLSDRPLPQADVVIIPRREMMDFRREELSNSKAYILADTEWSAQNLKKALSNLKGALFVDCAQETAEVARVLQVALARQTEMESHSRLMQMMRSQNRQIEDLNRGLEEVVNERATHDLESRRASQRNLARMREIIGFIKELSQLFDIADLLPLIRRQVKAHHRLEAPILFIPRGESFGDLYYMRGMTPIRTRVRGSWLVSSRILVSDPSDSQFLANATGRPFGKVLRFPLITVRHQKDASRSPLLLFEHHLLATEVDPLVASLSEILQPVSWALDRLVLEAELKSTSRDWEVTFDELAEPIAILDHDGRVLRSNSQWREEFTERVSTNASHFRHGERIYSVERYPVRMNENAPPLSWVVYLRDETRSQKLKSQAVQVEKMSAIGQLAGHIAHELNNPLTGIRSLTQVLLTETQERKQVHADLEEVEKAAARCQGIINNLLDFSRGGADRQIQVMDLNEIARRTLPFLKSATGRFRSDIQLSEGELPVRVEPQLMQQVIFNLINNACQAMVDNGEIYVHTRLSPPWAILEIKDTGPGVAEELKERIFEPFFTTKAEGEGTGLGLSFSRDFVRQFGGELECESKFGEGSLFRVRLPLESEP